MKLHVNVQRADDSKGANTQREKERPSESISLKKTGGWQTNHCDRLLRGTEQSVAVLVWVRNGVFSVNCRWISHSLCYYFMISVQYFVSFVLVFVCVIFFSKKKKSIKTITILLWCALPIDLYCMKLWKCIEWIISQLNPQLKRICETKDEKKKTLIATTPVTHRLQILIEILRQRLLLNYCYLLMKVKIGKE